MLNKTMVAAAIRFALKQKNWNQSLWHQTIGVGECGTTHCIAGFEDIRISTENGTLPQLQEHFRTEIRAMPLDLYNDVKSAWGATETQWAWITYADNTRADLLSIIEVLEGRAERDLDGYNIEGYDAQGYSIIGTLREDIERC